MLLVFVPCLILCFYNVLLVLAVLLGVLLVPGVLVLVVVLVLVFARIFDLSGPCYFFLV